MKSLLALATHSIPCSSSHAYRVAPFVLVKYATTSKSGRAWIATVSEREISKFRACKTSMQVTAFFANPIRVSLSTYEEEGWVDCLNVLGSSIESGMYMRREPSMHPTRRRDPHNPTLSIFTGQSFRICTKSNALWTMVCFWMCEQAKAMQSFAELRFNYQDAPPWLGHFSWGLHCPNSINSNSNMIAPPTSCKLDRMQECYCQWGNSFAQNRGKNERRKRKTSSKLIESDRKMHSRITWELPAEFSYSNIWVQHLLPKITSLSSQLQLWCDRDQIKLQNCGTHTICVKQIQQKFIQNLS